MRIIFDLSLLCIFLISRTTFALSILPSRKGFSSLSRFESFSSRNGGNRRGALYFSANDFDEGDEKPTEGNSAIDSYQRRELLQGLIGATGGILIGVSGPSVANAGEVGARITKAVTTSDLGISVRTSVVKGAQLADKIDGQWEKRSEERR